MAKSKPHSAWLKEHLGDKYVKQSKIDGYRSRASYKLQELQARDHLFKKGMCVVDLGSAPGGWSQVAVEYVGDHGRVIASDILSMDGIAGVEFIQGDFTEDAVYASLLSCVGNDKADLVISDMAPNMSGMLAVDQPKSIYLVELALSMAQEILKQGGGFVVKLFQGEGSDAYLKEIRQSFARVVIRKPDSSRARSREVYVVATGFKGN